MHNSPNEPFNPLLHATMTANLLDCINQISAINDQSLNCFIPDLIYIAAERANELARILETGDETHE